MEEAISDGFEHLVAHGRGDLTGEAIVVRHEDQFSVDAVNAARKKLMRAWRDHGPRPPNAAAGFSVNHGPNPGAMPRVFSYSVGGTSRHGQLWQKSTNGRFWAAQMAHWDDAKERGDFASGGHTMAQAIQSSHADSYRAHRRVDRRRSDGADRRRYEACARCAGGNGRAAAGDDDAGIGAPAAQAQGRGRGDPVAAGAGAGRRWRRHRGYRRSRGRRANCRRGSIGRRACCRGSIR